MAGRIVATALLILLAIGGFFGAGPTPASPLNPSGILFLVLSGVVWFAWELVSESFAAARDGGDIQIIRLAPLLIVRSMRIGGFPPREPPLTPDRR
ncbi:MAG TPA: hypothetical protein VFA12_05065 [Stellaceae bacterium]|nr:hypothetical protein [Stellaceae bacterium]